MPDFLKGCFFVGAAVAVGILAGLIVPSLVVDEAGKPETIASKEPVPRPAPPARPTMPFVVGQSVEDAERLLDRRGIDHETTGADIFGYVPPVFEVCESDPPAGEEVRGTASLRVDLPGLCA
jgi:hypothetical protein